MLPGQAVFALGEPPSLSGLLSGNGGGQVVGGADFHHLALRVDSVGIGLRSGPADALGPGGRPDRPLSHGQRRDRQEVDHQCGSEQGAPQADLGSFHRCFPFLCTLRAAGHSKGGAGRAGQDRCTPDLWSPQVAKAAALYLSHPGKYKEKVLETRVKCAILRLESFQTAYQNLMSICNVLVSVLNNLLQRNSLKRGKTFL